MPGKSQGVLAGAGTNQALPPELWEFLSRDTYSLLIKGDSGTGKTILALSILKALQPIENLLYLSTRTSPLQLVENYPWVEEIFGNAGTLDRGNKEAEGWETLVDSRLDEPNVVFERITNVLMDKQAPTVVIDSWESLSDTLGSEALRANIKVLQTWRERAGARFLFLGEDPTNSAIDFMVEGVVILKDIISRGKRLREILISKLHGVQIARPSYFFTLQEGKFTSFPAYAPRDYAFHSPLPVTLDRPFRRVKSKFPTGYDSLDAQLDGGFPSKSTALVEVDRRVDPRVGLIFLSRTVQDWLAAGDNVVLQRLRDVEPQYLTQFTRSFGTGSRGTMVVAGQNGRVTPPSRLVRGKKDGKKRRLRTLRIVNPGGLPNFQHGPGSWRGGEPDLTIILGRAGEAERMAVEQPAIHLKLLNIRGTLFVESVHPWSSLFAVVPAMTGGNPMMQLEPIV